MAPGQASLAGVGICLELASDLELGEMRGSIPLSSELRTFKPLQRAHAPSLRADRPSE